jgi:Tfp pilus assembly protein PilF
MSNWIKVQLLKKHPNLLSNQGVDLDRDGKIERFKDFDQNGTLGNAKDFEIYHRKYKPSIERNIPFFKWASRFDIKNPINEALSIDSSHATAGEIKDAYKFLAGALAAAKKASRGGRVLTHQILNVLIERGIRISAKSASLAKGIKNRALSKEQVKIIVVSLAMQLGSKNIRLALLPSETRIKEGNSYYDLDSQGNLHPSTANALKTKYLIDNSVSPDAYLKGLSAEQMTGHINYLYGKLSIKKRNYSTAELHFTRALSHHKKHVGAWRGLGKARYHTGRHQAAEAALSDGIKLDPGDELSFFIRARARLRLGNGSGARSDFLKACKVRGAKRRPVNSRCTFRPMTLRKP